MSHGCKTMPTEIGDDDVIDNIIKSKSISTFWTAETWLIFQLERRTKAQNVVNRIGCCTNFNIFTIITVVIIMLLFIINLEILASTQSLIAFSLLAKIYQFWQVCSSDGLSVCLSVRMKVVSRIQAAPFKQSSPNLTLMCILVMGRNPFII